MQVPTCRENIAGAEFVGRIPIQVHDQQLEAVQISTLNSAKTLFESLYFIINAKL